MSDAAFIEAAYPKHTAKELARLIGRALRTGKRIAYSGIIPRRLRLDVLTQLDDAIARREEHLRTLRGQLADEIAHEKKLADAAAARLERRGARPDEARKAADPLNRRGGE